MVRALLAAGANPNAALPVNVGGTWLTHGGATPLHYCAGREGTGCLPDALNPDGLAEVARLLLAAGADPLAGDAGGTTPLDVAQIAQPENTELIQVLRDAASLA